MATKKSKRLLGKAAPKIRTREEAIALARALLQLAGVTPSDLLTVGEVAELVAISKEAVRNWCRDGLGFFDERLHCFLIPRAELQQFLKQHRGFAPKALREFVPTQANSILSWPARYDMPRDARNLKPLSALEKATLRALQERAAASNVIPISAEERRLQEQRDQLVQREERASVRLRQLQADIDAVTDQINQRVLALHMQDRHKFNAGDARGHLTGAFAAFAQFQSDQFKNGGDHYYSVLESGRDPVPDRKALMLLAEISLGMFFQSLGFDPEVAQSLGGKR